MMTTQAANAVQTQNLSGADGFVQGSTVLTLEGELPVEFLSAGDRIITRDSGMATLLRVEAFTITCNMVWVMGGSLGHNKPDDDTLLPADQKILLRDWRAKALSGKAQALATMKDLVDGEFIRSAGRKTTTLYRLVFDDPHILYVDGLELSCETQSTLQQAD